MLGSLDDTEEATFAAVGLALTRWEEVEVGLADLYHILTGFGPNTAHMTEFCDHNRIFAARMDATERAAERRFRRFPDQYGEGEMRSFGARARRASRNRNLIAHGMVQGINVVEHMGSGEIRGRYGYLLMAPGYAMRRLGEGSDDGHGSWDINQMSSVFVSLRDQVTALGNYLLQQPPWH